MVLAVAGQSSSSIGRVDMRYGARVADGIVTDVFVLAEGAQGDEAVALLDLREQAGAHPSIGWSWDGSAFAPPPSPPVTWDDIRSERDRLLAASDWTQVADAPVDTAAWAVYRQALRDVPQNFATPDEVVWPTAP